MPGGFTAWAASREGWLTWGYGYRRRTARTAVQHRLAWQLTQLACRACRADGGEPCDQDADGTLVATPYASVHLDRARDALAGGLLDLSVLRAGLITPAVSDAALAELGDTL